MSYPLRVVVLGYIVRGPLGGMTWHHLQYVAGLARLGHEVFFIELGGEYEDCYNPRENRMTSDPAAGLEFIARTFARTGLSDRWAYFDGRTAQWCGRSQAQVDRVISDADLLLNISGVNPLDGGLRDVPVRILVDTDPVFTQIRHLTDPVAMSLAKQHTVFCTFGENIGGPTSDVPDDGLPWLPTRQPVVLDLWTPTPGPASGAFSTVMQWNSYASRRHEGREFGMKSVSFAPYMDLPERVDAEFELAIGSELAPIQLLRECGWRVRSALPVTRDPWTYQRFIQRSKGEFSVAKHGYVSARSGWFSERSAVYLASGRPVVVQDTGFTNWMETGYGALAFTTPDEAVAALERVCATYELHCDAARALAERYFDARVVLPQLLAHAMGATL